MFMKIHENAAGKVVAVCDDELVGKVLEDKKGFMDLDRYRGFYVGEKADEARVRDALWKFSSANLVGKNPVRIALDMKLVRKNDVMYINRIPYIQLYRI